MFKALMMSIRDKMFFVRKFHRFGGCPLALQIWLYECCSDVDVRIASRVHNKKPHILNWEVICKRPSTVFLCKTLFKKSVGKVFRNFLDSRDYMDDKGNEQDINGSFKKKFRPKKNERNCNMLKKECQGKEFKFEVKQMAKELSSLKKFVENVASRIGVDKACSSNPNIVNSQHERLTDHLEREVNYPSKFVLRSEFDKRSNEFVLFKEYVIKNLEHSSSSDNAIHEVYLKSVDGDEDAYADSFLISSKEKLKNKFCSAEKVVCEDELGTSAALDLIKDCSKDGVQFENNNNQIFTARQSDVEEKFNDCNKFPRKSMATFDTGDFSLLQVKLLN